MSKQLPKFAKVLVSNSRKKNRFAESERQKHCESWRQSGLSMNKYCQQHKLSISTLSNWLKMSPDNKSIKLLNTQTKENQSILLSSKQNLEIILTSGVRLRFSEITNCSEIVKLIKALEECN